ncbi:Swarming motility protein YbiA [Rosistilla carotiformis]|uniref:Swarming motility protein YbiA n=1 Tax=Rosistilla carotiformis TaxID=2528017 RepID=A0A518JQ90_9BACT|nr:NADAR family protein [Rosistilla carotiformis]QDV67688.1 Swarming motility protein YbiA [Rosistilla carotiformis]
MPETINFYLVDDEYGAFSNFAAYPIELDGATWPTTEHYFQAQKFAGTQHAEEIRLVESPMKAARMGRDRQRPLRSDWEDVKDDIMRVALYAKFTQHPDLRELLLGTGDAMIVEHTKNDGYWGDGGDGTGRNMLGQMLVELRARIQRG